ncbi:MAG: hypothetical protein JSV15_00885 [Candidatus Bathyarchaeota archaeon]|nr:MAG: hypothetical protein JSV15_00885 [Candidatus Bathyarchaeota archaeon]
MNLKKSIIPLFLLSVFVLTVTSGAVGQSTQEETRTVYYHGEEEGGLIVDVEAPYQTYSGEKINLTVKVRACTEICVLYMHLNISGLINEKNETLLRSITISELEGVDLARDETHQYPYDILIPAEISPGLTYGNIWYEWTFWGTSEEISPTGFPVTYVRNRDYEELRNDYQVLNSTYRSLQENYTKLESQYSGELGSTRNMMYVLIVTTVVSVVSIFILIRRPRQW